MVVFQHDAHPGAVLDRIGLARPDAESRPIGVVDLDLDPPGGGETLVRIEAAGGWHSDLSVVHQGATGADAAGPRDVRHRRAGR